MILGIDYGLRNLGLAISQGDIAEPKETIKIDSVNDGLQKIESRTKNWEVEKIIIGLSEGKSRDLAFAFGKKLESMLRLPVEYIDETLSTYEANTNAKKDKTKSHSIAAAVILQRYLEDKANS